MVGIDPDGGVASEDHWCASCGELLDKEEHICESPMTKEESIQFMKRWNYARKQRD